VIAVAADDGERYHHAGGGAAIRPWIAGALGDARMKHAAPIVMQPRGGGAGRQSGFSTSIIHSAAKAAANYLTRCVGMELGEHKVRVNSVSPGPVATGILAKALGMETRKAEDAKATVPSFYAKTAPPRAPGYPTTPLNARCGSS
jgi:NAD(P)-dependent dehydrogenase (short-subunit alcohol dehydrogenase family)